MTIDLKASIDRAIALMRTPRDYEKYISVKIRPGRGECCCFHCWPETWATINKYIYPRGPLEDEGEVLILQDNEEFVLQCHESGPEIVFYVGLGTASILLVKSVADLIVTLLKALQTEKRKRPANLKITWRRQIKGRAEEEQILEVDFPLADDLVQKLNDNLRNASEKKSP